MEKDDLVAKAKLAEQCERYHDMAEFMRKVPEQGGDLSNEERNLLSVAYKNEVGARRSAWRVLSNLLSKADENSTNRDQIRNYLAKVENELREICKQVLVVYPILTPQICRSAPIMLYLVIVILRQSFITWLTDNLYQQILMNSNPNSFYIFYL